MGWGGAGYLVPGSLCSLSQLPSCHELSNFPLSSTTPSHHDFLPYLRPRGIQSANHWLWDQSKLFSPLSCSCLLVTVIKGWLSHKSKQQLYFGLNYFLGFELFSYNSDLFALIIKYFVSYLIKVASLTHILKETDEILLKGYVLCKYEI